MFIVGPDRIRRADHQPNARGILPVREGGKSPRSRYSRFGLVLGEVGREPSAVDTTGRAGGGTSGERQRTERRVFEDLGPAYETNPLLGGKEDLGPAYETNPLLGRKRTWGLLTKRTHFLGESGKWLTTFGLCQPRSRPLQGFSACGERFRRGTGDTHSGRHRREAEGRQSATWARWPMGGVGTGRTRCARGGGSSASGRRARAGGGRGRRRP